MFACEHEEVTPGPPVRRQGADRRLPPARRDARDRARSTRASSAATRSTGPSSTATRTPATRSPAPPAIATLETFEQRAHARAARSPRSSCSRRMLATASRRCRRWPRSASAASWSGSSSSQRPATERTGHRVTLAARRRGAIIRPLGDVVVLMPALAITEADLAGSSRSPPRRSPRPRPSHAVRRTARCPPPPERVQAGRERRDEQARGDDLPAASSAVRAGRGAGAGTSIGW